MSTTITHKLSASIQAHGETLEAIELRRPTVQECRAIKALPYVLGDNQMPVVELEVAAKYIGVCAAIPQGSVNQLDLNDLNTLAWAVVGFFMSSATAQSET